MNQRHAATAETSLIAAKDPSVPNGDASALFLEHTVQRIVSETNDLMDAAILAPTRAEARKVLHAASQVRARVDAICDRAAQRMAEL